MTKLVINDLAASKELDSKAMASVSGGIDALQINGPNVTGYGDIVQANSLVDFDQPVFVFPSYGYGA